LADTPELEALRDICGRLEAAGVEYMLTGSLAASYYARPRMTRDIDMVLAVDSAIAAKLSGALGADYHADIEALTEAFRLMRPYNVIHMPTLVKVDLMPRRPGDYRKLEFDRRRKVDYAGVELWIVSLEDLILSKLDWARESDSELQLRDVNQLLEGDVDEPYLSSWVARLGLDQLLQKARNARHGP
jgi:hypothetical protein